MFISRCFAMLAVASLLLAGCASQQPTIPTTVRDDPVPMTGFPRVMAQDQLHLYLRAGQPVEERAQTPTGADAIPLKVTVPVRNLQNRRIVTQYRFTFFDANNVPLRPEMSWRRLAIDPQQQVFMQGATIEGGAADWRLEIRRDR